MDFQILLIVLSLAADAVIGNVQEKAMKQYGANQVEMVLYSYSLGTVYLFFGQVASGNFMPATRKRLQSFFTVRSFYNFRISSTTLEFNQQVLLELTMNFSLNQFQTIKDISTSTLKFIFCNLLSRFSVMSAFNLFFQW